MAKGVSCTVDCQLFLRVQFSMKNVRNFCPVSSNGTSGEIVLSFVPMTSIVVHKSAKCSSVCQLMPNVLGKPHKLENVSARNQGSQSSLFSQFPSDVK